MASDDEFARFQQLSDNYTPDVKGQPVGPLTSTQEIITEYAKADPIYINKTQAIPSIFSHYRPILGDGNCGWRAIAFGYFETLRFNGEPFRVQAEIARLKSTDNLLKSVGYDEYSYEGFTEQTFNLLNSISDELANPDEGSQSVFKAFNDQEITSGIIMHFRMITSAYLRTNAENYQPFCQEEPISSYCAAKIDTFASELEHLGLQALFAAVIKPAEVTLEITYLDLTPGTVTNTFKWDDDGTEPLVGTIRLLYRPGHYDILYKSDDRPAREHVQRTAQVHRVSYTEPTFNETPTFQHPFFGDLNNGQAWQGSNMGLDQWNCYSTDNPFMNPLYSPTHSVPTPSSTQFAAPASQACPSPSASHSPASPASPNQLQHRRVLQCVRSSSQSNHSAVTSCPSPPVAPLTSAPVSMLGKKGDGMFRPSYWDMRLSGEINSNEPPMPRSSKQEPCKTNAMLKYGEGKNHFMNPNFEPEHFDPDKEERMERACSSNGGSSRNSVSSRSTRSHRGSRRGSGSHT